MTRSAKLLAMNPIRLEMMVVAMLSGLRTPS